jgi:hypothetical protein
MRQENKQKPSGLAGFASRASSVWNWVSKYKEKLINTLMAAFIPFIPLHMALFIGYLAADVPGKRFDIGNSDILFVVTTINAETFRRYLVELRHRKDAGAGAFLFGALTVVSAVVLTITLLPRFAPCVERIASSSVLSNLVWWLYIGSFVLFLIVQLMGSE